MATRFSLLIALPLLLAGGCARAPATLQTAESCPSCHAPHRPDRGRCASCHRGDPVAERKELAHHRLIRGEAAEHRFPDSQAVAEGRRNVERLACRRCHTIDGSGHRLATNLDRVAWMRDQTGLARSLGEPAANMPRFGLDGRQTEGVIAYLLRSAGPELSVESYRVRFSRQGAVRESLFEKRCGGCHRSLAAQGSLGRGSAGPNLSGLFTAFYPATAPGIRPWTPVALGDWLKNPRTFRPATTMRPVRLEPMDLESLVMEIGGPATAPTRESRRAL